MTDRRAVQKAQTRARIRAVAQELFAAKGFEPVTIVEIAATARVSVQTVFNHYASKEEIFFSERAAWVEGPAAAVRQRAADEPPKAALRRYLLASIEGYARAAGDPCHLRMIQVLDDSPTLLTYERNLHEEAVRLLGEALADAWGLIDTDRESPCRSVLAEVTASVWMAAVRTIALDIRSFPPAPDDEDAIRARLKLLESVLDDLAAGLNFVRPSADGPVCQVA